MHDQDITSGCGFSFCEKIEVLLSAPRFNTYPFLRLYFFTDIPVLRFLVSIHIIPIDDASDITITVNTISPVIVRLRLHRHRRLKISPHARMLYSILDEYGKRNNTAAFLTVRMGFLKPKA